MVWARGGILQPMGNASSSILSLGRHSGCLARVPASVVEARFEVSGVVRVVGVRSPTDFDVALDFGAGGLIDTKHAAFVFVLGEPNAEDSLGR